MSSHVGVITNYTCTSNLVQSGPAQTGGRTDRQEHVAGHQKVLEQSVLEHLHQ